MHILGCSEDPDVKGTETVLIFFIIYILVSCSEDPDVKGTETNRRTEYSVWTHRHVAARIPM